MELAEGLGYKVGEKRLTRDDIYIADECFFTGTAAEVTPIRELDGRTIGAGKAGPVTQAIQKAFFDVVTGRGKKQRHWPRPVEGKRESAAVPRGAGRGPRKICPFPAPSPAPRSGLRPRPRIP